MTDSETRTPARDRPAGNSFDRERVSARLREAFIEHVSLEKASQEIMTVIREEFGLDKVAILVESNLGILSYAQSCTEQVHTDAVTLIKTAGRVLCIYDHMEDGPPRELLLKHGFWMGTPLMLKKLNLAALFLGHKSSGQPFGIEEVQFFDDIASDISNGIENAEAYDLLKIVIGDLEKWESEWATEQRETRRKESARDYEMARLKDAFESTVSQEIRVPIQNMRKVLETSAGSNADMLKALQGIEEGCEHLRHIRDEMIGVACSDRTDAPVSDSRQQKYDSSLENMLEEIMKNWKTQLAHKA